MCKKIEKCRICGNTNLVSILNLGDQYLTGVFPKSKKEKLTVGPLELLKCHGDDTCGLVQLGKSYDLSEMYGLNYGYRSGLNLSMVDHLHNKVDNILNIVSLSEGDLVIDVGSNDSTLLQAYPQDRYLLVGIDPTGVKFKEYYPKHIKLLPQFFSAKAIKKAFGNKKAKILTSISMFYDIESPLEFMREVYDVLDGNGVWVFEQSYMPTMLAMNAYDTICHEHLEYYRLKQIKYMADLVGFKILNVEFNNINGGSFSVMVAKNNSSYKRNDVKIDHILASEKRKGLDSLAPYLKFKKRVYQHRDSLKQFITKINLKGKQVLGYGASTKGNVILQFCGFTHKDIPFIAEVNKDKFGCFTPGTKIPIISEKEAKALKPDYFIVLPWHFKDNIVAREKDFVKDGGKLLFPLPNMKVVKK